ncbi:MAG TPA: GSCFA domain-containing protein [Bacteroidaceae bacterium]|nr:GSCFA domain-containing protein [Bacteroidaceae bacterium]
MKLQTPISIKPLDKQLTYQNKLLFCGSCFAEEIGTRFSNLYFKTLINPFGTLFNPISIAQSILRLSLMSKGDEQQLFTLDDVIKVDSLFCSFSHHSKFAKRSQDDFLIQANRDLKINSLFFKESEWIIVTLGTAFIYKDKTDHQVVSNCHKLPQNRFLRELLSVDETANVLTDMVKRDPYKNWIFTISPVRYLSDGLHQNQVSKSTLILAVEEVIKRCNNAHYFPAFEIVIDELRDYRFYAENMTHPSSQAVDYIFDRFIEYALSPTQYKVLSVAQELKKLSSHRPMFPDTAKSRAFNSLINKKREEFNSLININKEL